MELYVVCFLSVMILTTIIIKGIFCWMDCHHTAPWEEPLCFRRKKRSFHGGGGGEGLIHLEIPMEDMERTSTPVPMDDKMKPRSDFDSDV